MLSEDSVKHLMQIASRKARLLSLPPSVTDEYVAAFLMRCAECDSSASIAFLVVAGHNAGVDVLRALSRRQARECVTLDVAVVSTTCCCMDENLLCQDINNRVQNAVSRLTMEQRQVWHLCVVEERTTAEAAALLNKSAAAVRQSLSHTRKRLRVLLTEDGFDQAEAQDYLYLLAKKV